MGLLYFSTIIGIDVLYAKEATIVLEYTVHGTGCPKNMGIQLQIRYRLCYEFVTEFPCLYVLYV